VSWQGELRPDFATEIKFTVAHSKDFFDIHAATAASVHPTLGVVGKR
jgi:hypothetical protein